MSRRYQDQVEVRLGDPGEHRVRLEPGWRRGARPAAEEVPTLFLWQGRVHVVRGVLAQWTQRLPWWRELGATTGNEPDKDRTASAVPGTGSPGDGTPDAAGDPALEQEVWRVEASAGRSHELGVYDLVRGERWLLERVSD